LANAAASDTVDNAVQVSPRSGKADQDEQHKANDVIEEVVVTARRREEDIQDVPVAVTALSGEALAETGVEDITEINQSTPNTTLKVSRGTNSTLTAFIRGVGQQDPVAGFEPGVGIYLDGVYLARPQGAVLDVYDVQRIEVLRGPQGTLYGRNTIGGAIKYVTRRLGPDPELDVKFTAGSYGHLNGVITGSMPLSDTFAIGGTVATFNRDGYGKNLNTGRDQYNKDLYAGRISMEWTPSDRWFLKFSADHTEDNSNPKSGHRLTVSNNTMAPVLNDVFDTRAGIPGDNKVVQTGGQLLAQWDYNDVLSFKSITAYRKDHTYSPIDFDSLPPNDFDVPVIYRNRQFSQELQAIYSSEHWNWITGFYYLDANAFDAFDVVLGGLTLGGAAPDGITAFTQGDVNTITWAIYSDATYDINELWSISIGGRYTSDKRNADVLRQTFFGANSPTFGNPNALLVAVTGDFNGNKRFTKFTPKATVTYHADEDINLYASFSQGFKSGSFDPRGSQAAFPGVVDGFRPEILNTIEAGIKSTLNDQRIRANADVFYSDYKDIQIPGSVGIDTNGDGQQDNFAGTVTNAGRASIWGAEFESNALLTESLSAQVSVGYIHAQFDRFIVNDVNVADQRVFQNTPKWQTHFSLKHTNQLDVFGVDGDLDLIAALSYKSQTHQFENPNPFLDQPGYTLFDASVVWTSADGRYQVGVHGKNLTDKEYKVAGYFFPNLGLEGVVSAFYGDPRTVSATFEYRY